MNRAFVILLVAVLGCSSGNPPKAATTKPADKPAGKKVELAKNVYFEVMPDGQRRVLVNAEVCYREGPLEVFLCRNYTKEHESVLRADIDARDLHKALVAAGAVPGSPVKFEPTYQPVTGQAIRVSVRYKDKGEEKTIDARNWVRDVRTKKQLDKEWIFGGSIFFSNPNDEPDKPKYYAANGGEIVCLSNFGGAMMDVPIPSSEQDDELLFEAFTERIPELGAAVTVVFEPIPDKKDGKAK